MQMGAVVELAMRNMGLQVRHVGGKLSRIDVIQSKFLKTWRVDDGRGFFRIHPVPGGACGGVLSGIQRLRDFTGLSQRTGCQ